MGPEGDVHALSHDAVDHADTGNGAPVAIEIGIEDQGPERCIFHAAGWRDPLHDGLEQLGDPGSFLGGHGENLFAPDPDQVHDLPRPPLGLGAGEIDLVEHRNDFQARVEGEEEIRQRLRLDPLRRVHHQDGSLAGRE
jgi:hypothetical protein